MRPINYFAGQALHALLRALSEEPRAVTRAELHDAANVAATLGARLAKALCESHAHEWESDAGNGIDGGRTCARCDKHESAAEMCVELGHDWGGITGREPKQASRETGSGSHLIAMKCQRCGAAATRNDEANHHG